MTNAAFVQLSSSQSGHIYGVVDESISPTRYLVVETSRYRVMALRVPINLSPLLLLRHIYHGVDQHFADTCATNSRQHEQVIEITDRACMPGMWVREKMHQPDKTTFIIFGHATLDIVRRVDDTLPQQVGNFIRQA